MFIIGLTSDCLPPLYPSSKSQRMNIVPWSGRYGRRFAPCLYEAHQTKAGHWIWKKVKVIGESFPSSYLAFLEAQRLSVLFGSCRVVREALGNKVIK